MNSPTHALYAPLAKPRTEEINLAMNGRLDAVQTAIGKVKDITDWYGIREGEKIQIKRLIHTLNLMVEHTREAQ